MGFKVIQSIIIPFLPRFSVASVLVIFLAASAHALPLAEYKQRVQQAVTALDSLAQIDETESATAFQARTSETIAGVRNLLPQTETVQWNDTNLTVDHSWLHTELDQLSAVSGSERALVRRRVTERLQAIAETFNELDKPAAARGTKAEEKAKLTEILQRPEYAPKIQQESAVSRLVRKILDWIRDLFPKPKPVEPGTAGIFSKIAQVFVILLAFGVIAFALKMFLPRLLRSRKLIKKTKSKARIVLGETLEPDQSAVDLLKDAEILARQGDLRAAIRKAYIALLVELGDRKIISLAQHKTNRDYLRAVREVEPLYGNVRNMTESFELHWYGLTNATESDWTTFRSLYERALSR